MTDFRHSFTIPAWAVVRGYEWAAPAADQLRLAVVRWGVVRLAVDWWAVRP